MFPLRILLHSGASCAPFLVPRASSRHLVGFHHDQLFAVHVDDTQDEEILHVAVLSADADFLKSSTMGKSAHHSVYVGKERVHGTKRKCREEASIIIFPMWGGLSC